MLALVDLAKNQRVAAGATSAAIEAKAEVPEGSLVASSTALLTPRIRWLEIVASNPKCYRLSQDRLVPVLRRLAGRALAAADQLRLRFETEYVQWSGSRSGRHLLGGKELRGILRQRNQFNA